MKTEMKKIVIIYFTGTGHTAKVAEAVHEGATSVAGVEVESILIQGTDIVEGRYKNDATFEALLKADGIIFGTPTYMGGPSGQFKAFADASAGAWFGQAWKHKVAGGFTVSGNPSGDKLNTLQYLATLAAQHSMIWVNSDVFPSHYLGKTDGLNRLGSSMGIMAQDHNAQGEPAAIHPGDVLTAQRYGAHVAEIVLKLKA